MAEPFFLCEHEIADVCKYINDNQTVANYFGIPREKVIQIRGKMRRPRNPTRFLDSKATPLGINAQLGAHEDAIAGSRSLNDKIQKLFRKFEREQGLQYGAGEILLPAGWNGWQ